MPKMWRIHFMHVQTPSQARELEGVSSNTYTLGEALRVISHWSPSVREHVRVVPA